MHGQYNIKCIKYCLLCCCCTSSC
jgi:hypothetical protein